MMTRALVLSVQLHDANGSEVRALGFKQQPQCGQMPMFGCVHECSVPVTVDGIDESSERSFGGDILLDKQLHNACVTPACGRNQRSPAIPENEQQMA